MYVEEREEQQSWMKELNQIIQTPMTAKEQQGLKKGVVIMYEKISCLVVANELFM